MIRLLTFNRLRLRRSSVRESDETAEAAALLSAAGVSFDCHLLQHPARPGSLNALAGADQIRKLNAVAVDHPISVDIISQRPTAEVRFPGWIRVEGHVAADVRQCCDELKKKLNITRAGLHWIHLELPESFDGSADILQTIADSSAVSGSVPMIITAVDGSTVPTISDRFETDLPETSVRVPLWVCTSKNRGQRVAALTGSFDIMATLLSRLSSETLDQPLEAAEGPMDLMALCDNPRLSGDRSILIAHERGHAVRTNDFLFVATRQVEGLPRYALYAKPEDVWNVNDVTHEYAEAMEDFRAQLAMLLKATMP